MLLEAPAKLNLCLYLGGAREDGLHELSSLFEPIGLSDTIEVSEAVRDEVICPGVDGVNLAERALAELRKTGWDGPPVRIEITKRIPVAAGLGGGSADAAAVLRLTGKADGPLSEAQLSDAQLSQLAFALGADVPSQLRPGFSLVAGAGEVVEALPDPAPHGLVLLPGGGGLPTADVFAEADRLGAGRDKRDLAGVRLGLRAATATGCSPLEYTDLLVNDLQGAAISLRPDIEDALEALRGAGAAVALLSGSGPTAFGLFADSDEAARAADRIGRADAIACEGGRAL